MISQNTLYFEEYVSDMIPLERTLPDARGEWCRGEYGDTERFNGERTSVIICFHNEVCPITVLVGDGDIMRA